MRSLSLLNKPRWHHGLLLLLSALAFRTLEASAGQPAQPDSFGGQLVQPRFLHTAVRLLDDRVLLVSGAEAGNIGTKSCEIYTPSTNSWSATGNLSPARSGHTSLLLNDGRVLTMGGVPYAQLVTDSTTFYDPSAGTWTPGPDMLVARFNFDAVLLGDGKVLVIGGQTVNTAEGGPTAECELYDPIANTWTATGSLLQPRGLHHATILTDGRVLVAGGGNESVGLIPTTEIYDPATGAWTISGSLNLPRVENIQLRLTNGRVLIAGGFVLGPKGDLVTHRAELFNPETGTWSLTGSLHTARRLFTASLLNDGRVAAVGGTASRRAPSHALGSIEVFDPVTRQWSGSSQTLAAPRLGHTATKLADGSIIIAGGLDFNTLLPFAELFITPR